MEINDQEFRPTIHSYEEWGVDETGNRKAVLILISEWNQIVELLEELEDIQAYEEAKKKPSEPIPFGFDNLPVIAQPLRTPNHGSPDKTVVFRHTGVVIYHIWNIVM